MPRPPSERVEEGFQLWSTDGGRNDTKTDELMGVPQATVSYWKRTYHWHERYLELLGTDSEWLASLVRAQIRAALPAVTERLQAIVSAKKPVYGAEGEQIGETWASSDRDAVQAAKLLTQYGLEGGAGQGIPVLEAQAAVARHAPAHALEAMSAEEQAIAVLEANYHSVNTRIQPGRRT
jgi:hypothetical protein